MKKYNWEKLKLRIIIAWRIITNRYTSWAFLGMDNEAFANLVLEKSVHVDVIRHGMQEYNFYVLMKQIADNKTDVDMILAKMQFENEAQNYKKD